MLGIEGDQVDARLEIAGDMADRGETAPGDDLLDVPRLIEGGFDLLVAALPVGGAQMAGDGVVGVDIDHRSHDRHGRHRIIGGQLDDGVRARERGPQNGEECDPRRISGDDMDPPGPEGAQIEHLATPQILRNPAFQNVSTDLDIDEAGNGLAVEAGREVTVDLLQD